MTVGGEFWTMVNPDVRVRGEFTAEVGKKPEVTLVARVVADATPAARTEPIRVRCGRSDEARRGRTRRSAILCTRRECVVVDGNNRPLPRQFAERTATGVDLNNEIKENFAAGKFRQLISTIEQFRSNGWTAGGIQIDDETKFIPFVVAPNAGMPSNEFTELLVMQQAVPMIAGFDSKVLPPAIVTWRDLQLLEGIAEASPGRIIESLIMWRISNYRKVTEGLGLPESLSDFVDNNFTLGLPVSSHAREAALACWGRLREHELRRMHEAEQAGQ